MTKAARSSRLGNELRAEHHRTAAWLFDEVGEISIELNGDKNFTELSLVVRHSDPTVLAHFRPYGGRVNRAKGTWTIKDEEAYDFGNDTIRGYCQVMRPQLEIFGRAWRHHDNLKDRPSIKGKSGKWKSRPLTKKEIARREKIIADFQSEKEIEDFRRRLLEVGDQ